MQRIISECLVGEVARNKPLTQIFSHKILITIREKYNSHFIVQLPGRHHLNQVIKLNITNSRTYNHVPPDIKKA